MQGRKVFIAYPATLKYLDKIANEKILRDEEFKNMKSEMEKIYTVEPPCATTSRKRPCPMPPILNTKTFPVKAIQLELLENDHLLKATATTL